MGECEVGRKGGRVGSIFWAAHCVLCTYVVGEGRERGGRR